MKSSILLSTFILLTMAGRAQDVLKLGEGESAGKGSLSQLNWLAGYWKGSGLGGDCDELWLPATDNTIHGIFRFAKEGAINFTEYMIIEALEGSLTIKLKHFNRDLSPWEEKDKWTQFKLIKIEGQTAWFNGLTYHREGDVLTIKLQLKSKEKTWIEEFQLTRVEL